LIVGNDGTELVPETVPPEQIDGQQTLNPQVFYLYGFVTMEPVADTNWPIVFHDVEGHMVDCTIH